MDTQQKKVLRRKRHIVASTIEWDESLREKMKKAGLLVDGMQAAIENEGANFAKVSKFLELLPNCVNNSKAFAILCDILQEDYEWIADELHAELKAETGQLKVEEYIDKEAAILVHRDFGNSRRLSEAEKKEIKDLVALRTQYAKEVWMRQLKLAKKYLAEQTENNKEKDEFAKTLIEKVNSFIKVQRPRLKKTQAYESEQSTTEMFKEREKQVKSTNRPLLQVLEDAVADLIDMSDQSLLEKDQLQDDKWKALCVLKVTDPNAKLDKELELALERAAKELMAQQDDVKKREQRAQELRDQIAALKEKNEKAMSEKDKEIEELTQHLNNCHVKIRDTQDEIEQLKRELRYTREELAKYKKKSELLEKTRRLGYLEKGSKQEDNKKEAAKISHKKKGTKASS